MNDLTLIMTAVEARECVSKINSNLSNIRGLVYDLYYREGWKTLGYKNWRECVATEFGQHQSYLYRQLEAARIEKNISPIGENEEIPESQLRPLTKLDPDQQREVWKKAVETAPDGKITARHVQKIVNEAMETKRPEPETSTYNRVEAQPVSDAMIFAGMAISQLERIRSDDPKRIQALDRVAQWIQKNR